MSSGSAVRARLIYKFGSSGEGIANDGSDGKRGHRDMPSKSEAIWLEGSLHGPTKRAVIGDRPDLDRAWEEEKPIRLCRIMRFLS
ncbi:hypothetical protein NKI51_19660 [Mesorhizobium australicum]|uniref:Uncharacterized protein n=1 Tax=Mesorhizobium australicum TaxID=536018 RepID=A0ACC6T0D5_9HYPH|nr:hypothetical protein X738_09415 [Mesorhizobium sp. LNHC209A00]